MTASTNQSVPDGWEIRKLDSITKIVDSLHKTPSFTIEGYPIVRVSDIKEGKLNLSNTKKVTEFDYFEFICRYKPIIGDIVMSRVGTYGIVSYVSSKECFCIGQNTVVIHPLNINSVFLFYYLTTKKVKDQIEIGLVGSSQKTLSLKNIRKLVIYSPSHHEQNIIAAILSTIDNAIDQTDQLIERNKRIKEGLMQDFFCYGIDEQGNIRNEKTHRFKDSLFGRIPEEWVVYEFNKLLDQILDFRGKTPKKLGMEWGGGTIPALSANNVVMGGIDFNKETNWGSEELYKKWMNKGKSSMGDVIMTLEAPLGNVAQIPDNKKYILSQRVVLFKTKEFIDNLFFKYLLMSNLFQRAIVIDSTGTTATGIQQKKLLKIKLPIPPKNEQPHIAAILSHTDKAIELEESYKQKLLALRYGLMDDLLSGKVRVNHLIPAEAYA
ncbi:MAG: restriction endonuclease subunit S [Methanoregula sp.]|nr:restriction endonuclease subunit S [Methanoregula sp.]